MWKAKRDYWLKWLEKLLRKYFGAMQTAQLALVFISQRHLQNWSVSRTSNNDDKDCQIYYANVACGIGNRGR